MLPPMDPIHKTINRARLTARGWSATDMDERLPPSFHVKTSRGWQVEAWRREDIEAAEAADPIFRAQLETLHCNEERRKVKREIAAANKRLADIEARLERLNQTVRAYLTKPAKGSNEPSPPVRAGD